MWERRLRLHTAPPGRCEDHSGPILYREATDGLEKIQHADDVDPSVDDRIKYTPSDVDLGGEMRNNGEVAGADEISRLGAADVREPKVCVVGKIGALA